MAFQENELQIFVSAIKEYKMATEEVEKEIIKWFQILYDTTKVPVLNKAEDIPYTEDDFTAVYSKSPKHLNFVCDLLKELLVAVERCEFSLSHRCVTSIVMQSVLLAAQYQSSKTPWSSMAASDAAKEIIKILLEPRKELNCTGLDLLECRKTSQSIRAILGPNEYKKSSIYLDKILKPLLQYLSTDFVKELWKSNPGAQEVYLWLIYILPASDLSEQLGYLLPGALLMLDDWEQRHKLTAMKVLGHMLHNVAGSELRCYGRASVIYEATKHSLYSRDPDILALAYPVTVQAAAVVQADPTSAHSLQITAAEEVLALLLQEMCYEQRLDLRRAFAGSLTVAVAAAGLRAVRWLPELLEVVSNYLSTYDGEEGEDRIHVLQTVELLVGCCWSQLPQQVPALLTAVLRLLYDLHAQDCTPQARESLLSGSCTVVQLLHSCHPAACLQLCRGLEELTLQLPAGAKDNISRVFSPILLTAGAS